MAGRPASRGSGLTGLHYGLIAFVTVSVLCLGAFIWQLTINGKIVKENSDLQAKLKRYGQPPKGFGDEAAARGRGTSVFNVMGEYLQNYSMLVTGSKDYPYPRVEARTQRTLADAASIHEGVIRPTDNLLDAFTKLSSALAVARSANADLVAEKDRAQASLRDEVARNRAIKEDFDQQVGVVRQNQESAEERFDQAIADKEDQRSRLETQLEQITKQLNDLDVRGMREARLSQEEIERLQTLASNLSERLAKVQPPTFDPDRILTQADGRVIKAVPGSDLAYINIGARDGLKVGMGFEVFSHVDAPRGDRGKASLEVMTVDDSIAECRITRRTEGRPIIENDIVVNVVFERKRKPEFVVVGGFDLNYDGYPEYDGADTIRSVIRKWGGVVADEVSETTDFVVMGRRPSVPTPNEDALTDTVEEQVEGRKDAMEQWRQVVQDARDHLVPAMTQMQFLFLIGSTEEAPAGL